MIPVLIITFNFAPYNVTGTFRILKFVKYLPKYNIKPIVITANQGSHHINNNLFNDIPKNCKIYRLKSIFPDAQEMYKKKNVLYKNNSSIIKFLLKLLKDLLFSPDIHISWVIMHFIQIIRIIKKENVKTLFITGAPFSLFLLGSLIKKILKINLILDYRDCWQSDISQKYQTSIRRYFNKVMENFCINNSNAITSTSLNILNMTLKNNKCNIAEVIPTGYDPDDFLHYNKSNKNINKNFTFFYSGKFIIGDLIYDPSMLLESLNELSKEYPLKLIVCGNVSENDKQLLLKNYSFIDFKGFLQRKDLMNIAQNADAFIHFYYPTKMLETISFKLFEYSKYNKPIISLNTKNSEVSKFLDMSSIGFSVENNDKNAIVSQLKEIINLDKKQFLESINEKVIDSLSLLNTTRKLSEILIKVNNSIG